MNSFKVNGAEMMSVKYQIYSINTQARKNYLLNYRACIGTPFQGMDTVWAYSHNCEFLDYK